MASYFDLPPQSKATAAVATLPENEREDWTNTSLLSPQVTQILNDLNLEDRSSTSSEEDSLSEEDTQPKHSSKHASPHNNRHKQVAETKKTTNPSYSSKKSAPGSSKKSGSSHVSKPAPRSGNGGKSVRVQHPHMARFHSLRSVLFSSKIEQNIMKCQEEERMQEEANSKWRNQHLQRQISKPKTSDKESTPKGGLSRRITTRIRHMTSKEMPTMGQIKEGEGGGLDGRESTASSDNEDEHMGPVWKHLSSDEESIDNSDLDDLVRWVSRRDPPSDGEAQKRTRPEPIENDSAHESLGDSDVDDLVRWASRKSNPEEKEQVHSGYSDASTESDSDAKNGSPDEEDADELVRWISRRDGTDGGPVHQGNHSPELTRGRSTERSSQNKMERHLTHDDVDELVQWISRKDSKQQDM